MITLRQLLELNQTTTLLDLYVRDPEGWLIKRSVIGKDYGRLSMYEKHDMSKGRLEIIDNRINIQGRPKKNGQSEMTYGMIWEAIPKDYLDAEVTSVSRWYERFGRPSGSELHATIVPIQITMDCTWK